MTTDPQTDRPRALALLEAADFLRDAHFRDGLSVQEIGTALRNMADAADPMVGSLARDGFGLDEIAAMPAAPPAPADRAAVLREAADAITAVIEADRAYSPRRSNDRAALGGAREIVLGLIDQPGRMADEAQQADTQEAPRCSAALLPFGSAPADPCVRQGRHHEHVNAEGHRWTTEETT